MQCMYSPAQIISSSCQCVHSQQLSIWLRDQSMQPINPRSLPRNSYLCFDITINVFFCFCLHGFRDIRTIWLFIWNAYWSGRWSLLSLIMLLHLRFKIASVSTALPLPTSYFPENLSSSFISFCDTMRLHIVHNMYLHSCSLILERNSISAISNPFCDNFLNPDKCLV